MKGYMERKYYLRGLGIGIAVTAIIMGIAVSGKQTMTDEEVIARAKELGMVENTLLSDTLKEETAEESAAEDSTEQKNTVQDNTVNKDNADDGATAQNMTGETSIENKEQKPAAEKEQESVGTVKEETQDKQPDKKPTENIDEKTDKTETAERTDEAETPEKTDKPDKNDEITSAAIKTITVTSGDGSYTVAKKLADAGVVISAENFDKYLCQNGYDKKLRTGTFSIPADASDEQIARIVTGAE